MSLARPRRRRRRQRLARNERRRGSRFLQSSGGTALITVVLGGIVGSLITGMVQSATHEREFDLAWLKARGDQALGAYRDYLDKEQGLVSQAYGLVGEVAASAETLINLASEGMDWNACAPRTSRSSSSSGGPCERPTTTRRPAGAGSASRSAC